MILSSKLNIYQVLCVNETKLMHIWYLLILSRSSFSILNLLKAIWETQCKFFYNLLVVLAWVFPYVIDCSCKLLNCWRVFPRSLYFIMAQTFSIGLRSEELPGQGLKWLKLLSSSQLLTLLAVWDLVQSWRNHQVWLTLADLGARDFLSSNAITQLPSLTVDRWLGLSAMFDGPTQHSRDPTTNLEK